jgi:hypothetical protein
MKLYDVEQSAQDDLVDSGQTQKTFKKNFDGLKV